MKTLNQLIEQSISGAEDSEEVVQEKVAAQAEDTTPAAIDAFDLDESEKIASALDYIGRTGIENFIKTAMAMCPGCGAKCKTCKGKACGCCKCGKKKEAMGTSAAAAPPGTNEHQMHRETTKSQVPHNSASPPMKEAPYGSTPTNADAKPGGGKEVDTTGKQQGTHHPALSGNEAAIAFTKKEQAKKNSPALGAVLDAAAYADPKLKESLDHTEGDRNIHSKKASADQLEQVREELARRTAAQGGQS